LAIIPDISKKGKVGSILPIPKAEKEAKKKSKRKETRKSRSVT